jgi:putative ABC transport system ATP-binding protein
MRLALKGLIPVPLIEKVETYNSGIWKTTLNLEQGEQVFVQAPSGTGKTTLMHILYGIRKDFEGQVYWDANSMEKIGTEQLSQIRASYLSIIFQDLRVFPDLTAWENLEVKRRLTNTITEEEVTTWLERLGLKDKRDSLAGTMSYGEQQRLCIIRALVQPFDWLLMDEPFSHLDKLNIGKAINLIAEVVAKNKAGMILADLDENYFFPYTQTFLL